MDKLANEAIKNSKHPFKPQNINTNSYINDVCWWYYSYIKPGKELKLLEEFNVENAEIISWKANKNNGE